MLTCCVKFGALTLFRQWLRKNKKKNWFKINLSDFVLVVKKKKKSIYICFINPKLSVAYISTSMTHSRTGYNPLRGYSPGFLITTDSSENSNTVSFIFLS